MKPSENDFNRLARAMMSKDERIGYEDAIAQLSALRLKIICDDCIAESTAMQAALLTAVNTGQRAFLGGVSVFLPGSVTAKVCGKTTGTLNEMVAGIGGQVGEVGTGQESFTLILGDRHEELQNALRVSCDGWRARVSPVGDNLEPLNGPDFALGGVAAGALGVAGGFLNVSGLDPLIGGRRLAISLWRPDLPVGDNDAGGPRIVRLPKRAWLVGLGHLGQGYLWSLGLLPFRTPENVSFVLQDDERIVAANWGAGLLCDKGSCGQYKTRQCSQWLENGGFRTNMIEHRLTKGMTRYGEEPLLALFGVDDTRPRRLITEAGFDYAIDCGLGMEHEDFDSVSLHTFPNSHPPGYIWPETQTSAQNEPSARLREAVKGNDECGILATTLANTAISASFVGAFAGALTVAEILRGLHGGARYESMTVALRNPANIIFAKCAKPYAGELASNGYVEAMTL